MEPKRMNCTINWLLKSKFCWQEISIFSLLLASIFSSALAIATETPVPQDVQGWSDRIERALREGKNEEALREIDAAIAKSPGQAQLYLIRGSLQFRSGHVDESLKDFDACLEREPSMRPYLWQRGIALYYAGRYQDGIDQFTTHREVNPNDVENAFWHFLCAAKLDGVEAAQKTVLLSGHDRRIPMMQVQELIQGKKGIADVIEAAEKIPSTKKGSSYDRFYGYLYAGLYCDAIGKPEEAAKWLEKSVDEKVDGYMYDVAKVHLALLKKAKPK